MIYNWRFLLAALGAIIWVFMFVIMSVERSTALQILRAVESPAFLGTLLGSMFSICGSLYVIGWTAYAQRRRDLELLMDTAFQIEAATQFDALWTPSRSYRRKFVSRTFLGIEGGGMELGRESHLLELEEEWWIAAGCIGTLLHAPTLLAQPDAPKLIRRYAGVRAYYRLQEVLQTYEPTLKALRSQIDEAETKEELRVIVDRASDILWHIGELAGQLRAQLPRYRSRHISLEFTQAPAADVSSGGEPLPSASDQ